MLRLHLKPWDFQATRSTTRSTPLDSRRPFAQRLPLAASMIDLKLGMLRYRAQTGIVTGSGRLVLRALAAFVPGSVQVYPDRHGVVAAHVAASPIVVITAVEATGRLDRTGALPGRGTPASTSAALPGQVGGIHAHR